MRKLQEAKGPGLETSVTELNPQQEWKVTLLDASRSQKKKRQTVPAELHFIVPNRNHVTSLEAELA